MNSKWRKIANRIVLGLGVQPGELVDVRDSSGDLSLLQEVALAIERAGATPLIQFFQKEYLEHIWTEVPLDYLTRWGQFRQDWMQQVDRVLVLGGARPEFHATPAEEAWQQGQTQLTVIEERRRLPYLLAAIPTAEGARQLNLPVKDLEEILLPALEAGVDDLQLEINRVLSAVQPGETITIYTGQDHELKLKHGERAWLMDDGYIDMLDRDRGAIVSNLPAGSIYTTVIEEETQGSLWLPKAGAVEDVVFHFAAGRIVEIQAASGADQLIQEFNRHSGEPRRISHVGLGLNPYLSRPTGWTVVDEHIHGRLFIALGENRYMGGQNVSSLNVDYALAGATLKVNDQMIVVKGKLVV